MWNPEIASIEISAPFRYLWLKYITGANLNHHCAKGLLGSYSKRISPRTGKEEGIILSEHPAKILYLCGVSSPYRWEKNFHLAFLPEQGAHIEYESNGIAITIANAERIHFEAYNAKDRSQSEHRDKAAYHTCRNWICANYCMENGLL